jgi:molecular chaperone GrpE
MDENKKYPVPGIGVFIFNPENKIFLMRCPAWGGKYACPGGKIEIGETIEAAAVREILEETGLEIKNIKIKTIFDALDLGEYTKSNQSKHMIFINSVAGTDSTEVKLDNHEGTEYAWLSLDDWLAKKDEISSYSYRFLLELKQESENNWEEKYKRSLADQQNLIKQVTNEKVEFIKYANENLIYDLVPVYDHLKLSISSLNDEEKKSPWVEGVKHVLKQFKDTLSNNGVEEIISLNKKFDHNLMEAIEGTGEKVIKELKTGYKLNGKVIIPAKVILDK